MPSSSRDRPPRLTISRGLVRRRTAPSVTEPADETRGAEPRGQRAAAAQAHAAVDFDLLFRCRRDPVFGMRGIDEHEARDIGEMSAPRKCASPDRRRSVRPAGTAAESPRARAALEARRPRVRRCGASDRDHSSRSPRDRSCRRASDCATSGWTSDQLMDEPPRAASITTAGVPDPEQCTCSRSPPTSTSRPGTAAFCAGSPLTPLTLWSVFSVECLLANA